MHQQRIMSQLVAFLFSLMTKVMMWLLQCPSLLRCNICGVIVQLDEVWTDELAVCVWQAMLACAELPPLLAIQMAQVKPLRPFLVPYLMHKISCNSFAMNEHAVWLAHACYVSHSLASCLILA